MSIEGHVPAGPASSVVYVVDGDADFRQEMILGLSRLGLDAQGFDSAGALYRAFVARRPDIVVLDTGLKDEDGLSVAKHLLASSSLGIILAAGEEGIDDGNQALEIGAHAYLVKPLNVSELAATVDVVKQRLGGQSATSSPQGSHHWSLDQSGWVLTDGLGHRLQLTKSERRLLECLFAARGEIVERQTIIEYMGGNIYDFNYANLDTIVSRLRKRANKSGMTLPLQVVRGRGFALTP